MLLVPRSPAGGTLISGVYALEDLGRRRWRGLRRMRRSAPRGHGSEARADARFPPTIRPTFSPRSMDAISRVNVGKGPVSTRLPMNPQIDIRLRSSRSFPPGALLLIRSENAGVRDSVVVGRVAERGWTLQSDRTALSVSGDLWRRLTTVAKPPNWREPWRLAGVFKTFQIPRPASAGDREGFRIARSVAR